MSEAPADPGLRDNALLALAHDADAHVRESAAWAMTDRPGREVTDALITLTRDANPRVRERAVWALTDRPSHEVTAALISRASDADTGVRERVPQVLAARPEREVTEALLTLAGDADTAVRDRAAVALAGRVDPAITQWFLQLSRKRTDQTPTPLGIPDDCTLWYKAAIVVASNSRSWPRGDREQIIDAIGSYTGFVTTGRVDA